MKGAVDLKVSGLSAYMIQGICEVGCDEAGRGCLAGPVFAAAVIIPEGFHPEGLNDSKQLKESDRDSFREIIESECIWSVASLDAAEIDRINILNASIAAMHLALEKLGVGIEHIIVDGNRFKKFNSVPHTTVVKGDSKFLSIAAASVLAKTHRDEYMKKISLECPAYKWERNKGYPTLKHREAIRNHGVTEYHRKTFTLLPPQLNLF